MFQQVLNTTHFFSIACCYCMASFTIVQDNYSSESLNFFPDKIDQLPVSTLSCFLFVTITFDIIHLSEER